MPHFKKLVVLSAFFTLATHLSLPFLAQAQGQNRAYNAPITCPKPIPCDQGSFFDPVSCKCQLCAVPSCAAPPFLCHYESPPFDANGCQEGCGRLVCAPGEAD